MTPDRLAELDSQFGPDPGSIFRPVNRDFAPVAYYFDIALWSSQFHTGYRRLFRTLAAIPFAAVAILAAIVIAALVLGGFRLAQSDRPRFVAGASTAATGFTMMTLEMLLLLAFQAVYGYVYQQLAWLIAAFMTGMAVGAWLAFRLVRGARMHVLAATQFIAAAAPLILLGVFAAAGNANSSAGLAGSRLAFPALALLSGMLGGFEFRIAGRIFFSETRSPAARHPGTLYALDLAGSCLAAALISVWLIPLFGFVRTALLCALVSLAPAALALSQGSAADPAE